MDFLQGTQEIASIELYVICVLAWVGVMSAIIYLITKLGDRARGKRKRNEPAFKIDVEYIGFDAFSYHLIYQDNAGYYCMAGMTMDRAIAEGWRDKFGCKLEV